MQISLFITNKAIQFNLKAETDQEKEMVKILNKYHGPVHISQGADIGMCRGNFVRNFSQVDAATTITIEAPITEDTPQEG